MTTTATTIADAATGMTGERIVAMTAMIAATIVGTTDMTAGTNTGATVGVTSPSNAKSRRSGYPSPRR
ncbi:hypothetical protein BH10PSE1_BH10PSE1_18850 [soil metagenome]